MSVNSLLEIEPLQEGSRGFPFKSYKAAARAFIKYACEMPEGFVDEHPLNDKNPKTNSLYYSQKDEKVFFIGGPWNEAGPSNPGKREYHVDIPNNTPIVCCALLSIISPEEFPHRFGRKEPPQRLWKEANKVIGDSEVEIKITDDQSHRSRKFNKRQLERVRQDTQRDPITVSDDVWPAMRKGRTVHGCWEGYFLILPGFAHAGDDYTFHITANCRMFDAPKAGLRFRVNAKIKSHIV